MIFSRIFFLLFAIRAVHGQDCASGSFYDDLNSNVVSSIDAGYWYLNLDKPCSCSGKVDKYEVKYYTLRNADYKVHAVMWELKGDGLYYKVSGTKELRENNSRRKKRAGTSGGKSKNAGNNVFVRKGAVIGVYFKTNDVAMLIIGNATAGNHSVCKYQGDKDNSSPIDCTSSLIQTDIIIHAEGQINKLECKNPDGITNGNFELIDGDKEYGARVQYTCVTGYEIISGDELLTCNKDELWVGTVPTCQIVSCVTVNAPLNGIIVNMGQDTYTYGDSVSFSCNTGYMIAGNESITCLADGNWNGSTPLCVNSSQTMSSDYVTDTNMNTLAMSTASTVTTVEFNSQLKSINISETAGIESTNSPPISYTTVISATISAQTRSVVASPGAPSSTVPNSQSGSVGISETVGIGGNNNSQVDGSNSNGGVIAAVIIVVLAIVSVSVVLLIIFLVMARRRNKRKTETLMKNDDLSSGFNNLVYQANGTAINGREAGYKMDRLTNPVYDENSSSNKGTAKRQVTSFYEPVDDLLQTDTLEKSFYFELEPTLPTINSTSHYETPDTWSTQLYETCTDVHSSEEKERQFYNSLEFNSTEQKSLNGTLSTIGEHTMYEKLHQVSGEYSELEHVLEQNNEDPIYWAPENDAQKIYEQLEQKKYREIPREQIQIAERLGSGQYGTVDKGFWNRNQKLIEVAVKGLKGVASEEEEIKFLQEAAINGQFHHPNVVRLFGVVTVGHPTLIILEFIPNGDLRGYLISKRAMPGELTDDSLPSLLVNFSHQVARGMAYLSRKKFIHRDLAARNVLVGYNNVCKIADFGMSRNLQDETYYKSTNKRIPVKWTAPEAVYYHKYSTQSDVWSFGSVLYEIWSVGYKPFQYYSNQECIELVESGYRLPSPPGCPRSVYELMIKCWNPTASDRPTFEYLESELSEVKPLVMQASEMKARLGADVDNQDPLYPELQNKYK